MAYDRLLSTLIELVGIPATSGHEEQVRSYIEQRLSTLEIPTQVDATGNLIATLSGTGRPILLNAHMDRVPPGKGHTPVLRDDILYSDGTTNLGADDAAGIAIILEVVTHVVEQSFPHPPLVIVFTVQEEAGLCGAAKFDASRWNVHDGIVFDNAFEAGIVVSQGAAYEGFDVRITGRTGHPGKDLSSTVNAIEIFHHTEYPVGSFADDQTRILIGRIAGGSTRNAIPDSLTLEGELRSFESAEAINGYKKRIERAFTETAQRYGGRAEVSFQTHSMGYAVDATAEPLLWNYHRVRAQRGAKTEARATFIGSDTSGFRPDVRVFTLSTGVVNEHSVDEYVPVAPLEQIVQDTLQLLEKWAKGWTDVDTQ